jgi:predicted GNAT family acetyltransferase
MSEIIYKTNLENIDWTEMKTTLRQDAFDNGRSPEQLKASFENSYAVCIAYAEGRMIGTARVLSDGVCNAYLVDVWTLSEFRHKGIASTMIQKLMSQLNGQHVYLQTDDAQELYAKLGFVEQPTGMSKVVGKWLVND